MVRTLYLSIDGNYTDNSTEEFKEFIDYLEESSLPKPEVVRIIDKEYPVNNFSDTRILRCCENGKQMQILSFFGETDPIKKYDKNQNILMSFDEEEISIGIHFNYEQKDANYLIKMFLDIKKIFKSAFIIRLHSNYHLNRLKELYTNERSFYSFGLYWLTYYAGEELRRQGGEALLDNPHVTKTEKMGDGIFIQVNESLEECETPEGEERLIKATEAMPEASWF